MLDLLELLHQFLSDGLSWASVTAIILAVLKIRDSQHKRKVNVQLGNDIRAIKERLGIWSADSLQGDSSDTATRRSNISPSCWGTNTTARIIGKFTHWRLRLMDKLKNINKALLLPLLAAIATFVKHVYGYDVPDETLNTIADISLYTIAFIGLFVKPTKTNKEYVMGDSGDADDE